jgi:3-methyladenine DNA glycosylase AlkD
MVRVTHFFQLADWFNAYLVAKHPQNEEIREKWMNDNNPAAARAGWNLCSIRVSQKAEYIDTAQILNRLENEMKKADQYVQWTMNFTLVNIGIYHQELRDKAIQVSEDLGVYKDFPVSKGCTSPYAPIWINEMVSRLKK